MVTLDLVIFFLNLNGSSFFSLLSLKYSISSIHINVLLSSKNKSVPQAEVQRIFLNFHLCGEDLNLSSNAKLNHLHKPKAAFLFE